MSGQIPLHKLVAMVAVSLLMWAVIVAVVRLVF